MATISSSRRSGQRFGLRSSSDSRSRSDFSRPMKPTIEVSKSGRIKQTAFKADMVVRQFVGADGQLIERSVPGSFYEFITREHYIDSVVETRTLDLGFDAANAQGIFKMTAAG